MTGKLFHAPAEAFERATVSTPIHSYCILFYSISAIVSVQGGNLLLWLANVTNITLCFLKRSPAGCSKTLPSFSMCPNSEMQVYLFMHASLTSLFVLQSWHSLSFSTQCTCSPPRGWCTIKLLVHMLGHILRTEISFLSAIICHWIFF